MKTMTFLVILNLVLRLDLTKCQQTKTGNFHPGVSPSNSSRVVATQLVTFLWKRPKQLVSLSLTQALRKLVPGRIQIQNYTAFYQVENSTRQVLMRARICLHFDRTCCPRVKTKWERYSQPKA